MSFVAAVVFEDTGKGLESSVGMKMRNWQQILLNKQKASLQGSRLPALGVMCGSPSSSWVLRSRTWPENLCSSLGVGLKETQLHLDLVWRSLLVIATSLAKSPETHTVNSRKPKLVRVESFGRRQFCYLHVLKRVSGFKKKSNCNGCKLVYWALCH